MNALNGRGFAPEEKMRQFAKLVVLQLLRAYKWAISPLLPPACRYVPTCSEYAMEAIERCGVLRGGLMASLRLLRCHPFVRGGYDPVVKHAHISNERPDDRRPLSACPERSEGMNDARHRSRRNLRNPNFGRI
jgi:hypothetical protein